MGYPNHAAYGLENQTARTTEAVNERLASKKNPVRLSLAGSFQSL